MGQRRIRSNHQIQMLKHRRRVQESTADFIQLAPQVGDGKTIARSAELFATMALLQAQQLYTRQLGQGRKLLQRDGTMPVAAITGIPLPGESPLSRRPASFQPAG